MNKAYPTGKCFWSKCEIMQRDCVSFLTKQCLINYNTFVLDADNVLNKKHNPDPMLE